MKRLVLIGILFLMTIVVLGQSKWDGFFRPVTTGNTPAFREATRRVLDEGYKAMGQTSVWLFRPTVGLSAIQFTWSKEAKAFQSVSFSSVGMGIGYQHYTDVNNSPYNNFGFNALVLLNQSTSEDPASISLAGTVSALEFVNLGAGYDVGRKVFFLLTAVNYSF